MEKCEITIERTLAYWPMILLARMFPVLCEKHLANITLIELYVNGQIDNTITVGEVFKSLKEQP